MVKHMNNTAETFMSLTLTLTEVLSAQLSVTVGLKQALKSKMSSVGLSSWTNGRVLVEKACEFLSGR